MQRIHHVLLILVFLAHNHLWAQQPGLHVAEDQTVLFGNRTTGRGVKAFWLPSKSALRAGLSGGGTVGGVKITQADSTNWDPDSIGVFSFALGASTKAKGALSIAFGQDTEALGSNSTVMGFASKAIGSFSTAIGFSTIANGSISSAMGEGTQVNGYASTAMGLFNKPLDLIQFNIEDTTRLLIIGNGNSDVDRSNAMVVQKNGRVGIGTNRPGALLHVAGNTNIGAFSGSDELGIFDTDDDGDAVIRAQTTNGGVKELVMGLNISNGGILGTTTNTQFTIRTNNFNRIWIKSDGDIGIGVSTPSEKLDVNGNARFRSVGSDASTNDLRITSDGTLTTSTSDLRLKENIATLDYALDKISRLRGVSFNWQDQPQAGIQHGLIAQEVQNVVPELVFERNGYLGVDYSELVGLFVEAIKEQKVIIEQQGKAIEELRNMILTLHNPGNN